MIFPLDEALKDLNDYYKCILTGNKDGCRKIEKKYNMLNASAINVTAIIYSKIKIESKDTDDTIDD